MKKIKKQVIANQKMIIPVKKNISVKTSHKTEVSSSIRRQIFDIQAETDPKDSKTLVFKIKNIVEEPIPVPAPPTPSFPVAILSELEGVSGKIRTQISSQLLKSQMLQEIAHAKHLLRSWKIMETIHLLRMISGQLQICINSNVRVVPINLTLKGINKMEQKLLALLY